MATIVTGPSRDLHEYISENSERDWVRAGWPLPLGVSQAGKGFNFSVFSRNASRVRLEFFDHFADVKAARTIDLDSALHRTGDVWHVWVAGVRDGQLYGYRVDGPYDPLQGQRFNFNRLLLDPLTTAISQLPAWNFATARGYDANSKDQDLTISRQDNAATMPKCVLMNECFDWRGDQRVSMVFRYGVATGRCVSHGR